MKTIIFAILAFVLSANVFAADPFIQTVETTTSTGKQIEQTFFKAKSKMPDKRLIKSYDAEGNLIERTTLQWKSNSWTPLFKHMYTYDLCSEISTVTYLSWNSRKQMWYNRNNTIAIYSTQSDQKISVLIANI